MNTILILDVNYLAHRANYTTGQLMHDNVLTGVAFGILRDVIALQERFGQATCVFCFDSAHSLRKDLYPNYKKTRCQRYHEAPPEAQKSMEEFREQVVVFRREILRHLGYNNRFIEPGYESDDIIASVCRNLSSQDTGIIISADKDLYQCLSIAPEVILFNPQSKKLTNYRSFMKHWGITPDQWPHVKAWAGCTTDDIEGIRGIGEKTAAKFLRGEIKSKRQLDLFKNNKWVFERNLPLVTLPFKHTPKYHVISDKVTKKSWNEGLELLGIASLRNFIPVGVHDEKGFGFDG